MAGGAAMSRDELAAQALATEGVETAAGLGFVQAGAARPGVARPPGASRGLAAFRGHVDHARDGGPVKPVYAGGVPLGDDPAAAFERGGELAGLCGPFGGAQGEPAPPLGPVQG